MSWYSMMPVYSILLIVIELSTGLLIGLSLTGINVKKSIKRLMIVSISGTVFYFLIYYLTQSILTLLITYLLVILIIKYLFKIPLMQSIIIILLALTFDLMVINLLEHNIFDVVLMNSEVNLDKGTRFFLDLFIAFNNILISMYVYSKTPVLFPKVLFEKSITEYEADISFSGHTYFVVFILSILSIGLYFTSTELEHIRLYYRLFITFWSIVVCVSLLYFLRTIILYKNDQVQLFLDKQYQKDVLGFYSIIRSQRHDFNFHLTAIYGLIQKKNYLECERYIEDMVKEASDINELLPLKHPAIAAMLTTFKEIAANAGVQITYVIRDDLRNLSCSIFEINKILGNLIQNAIDEVEQNKEENSGIYVEIYSERGNIVISVSNETRTAQNVLEKIFEIGFTTKKSHEGLGLPSVQKILSKYNGVIFPRMEGNIISFIVKIPIPS